MAGFKACGIAPFDPSVVLKKIPHRSDQPQVNENNEDVVEEETLEVAVEDMVTPTSNNVNEIQPNQEPCFGDSKERQMMVHCGDGDYSNEDTDYNPEDDDSTSHSSEGLQEIKNEKEVIKEDSENAGPPTHQTGRKRLW
ncbi:hypothetical protein ILUMI_15066 [Ignelater luminosus]|uniref:Uncharacterized protein n=1 Tax=Ignelater luminosus TaxID=2038154 RepID=A0A8K0CTN5_IGNLU|nr:hypothetical protein ILUMI_15066 [Ignelater luminosus]